MTAATWADLPSRTIEKMANHLVNHPFEFWRYGDSIGFEGLLAATQLLNDPQYFGWARGAIRGWAATCTEFTEMDNTAPGLAMCEIYEATHDEAVLTAATTLADHLRRRPKIGGVHVSWASAPLREPRGGRPLTATESDLLSDPGPGVFLDCLHFDPPFFTRLGRLAEDSVLQKAGVEQALGYVALLQHDDGLFDHFWLERTQTSYGRGWGRGQGWALLGLLDVLTDMDRSDPQFVKLHSSFVRLVNALIDHQQGDGSWNASLNDAAASYESSTAAFVVTGIARAIDLKFLDATYLPPTIAAWNRLLQSLSPNGELMDVSGAVWPSTSDDHYRYSPTGFNAPWGLGPALTAAIAVSHVRS